MTMVASNLTYPYGPLIKRHMQYKLWVEGEWSFPCEDMFEILNPNPKPYFSSSHLVAHLLAIQSIDVGSYLRNWICIPSIVDEDIEAIFYALDDNGDFKVPFPYTIFFVL